MNNDDIVRNTLIGLSSAVPGIGSSISILLDKTIPCEVEERANCFLFTIERAIHSLGIRIRYDRWEDEKFKSLFRKVLDQVISEHTSARRAMLQNITIHLLTDDWFFNEEDFYIYLTDRLSNYSIQYLYCCYTNTHIDSHSLFRDYPILHEYILEGSAESNRYMLARGKKLTSFGRRYCDYVFSPLNLLQS